MPWELIISLREYQDEDKDGPSGFFELVRSPFNAAGGGKRHCPPVARLPCHQQDRPLPSGIVSVLFSPAHGDEFPSV